MKKRLMLLLFCLMAALSAAPAWAAEQSAEELADHSPDSYRKLENRRLGGAAWWWYGADLQVFWHATSKRFGSGVLQHR